MGSKIKKEELAKQNPWKFHQPKTIARLDNSRKKIGYFANYNNKLRFFQMDLLSGNLVMKSKIFHDTISDFLWMKDNLTILYLVNSNKERKWKINFYNEELNLLFNYFEIKGKYLQLLCLDEIGNELFLKIEANKSKLFAINLETKEKKLVKTTKINSIYSCYKLPNDWLIFSASEIGKINNKIFIINTENNEQFSLLGEIETLNEKINGITSDGKWLAFTCYKKYGIKGGLINLYTGEINWLPAVNEEIISIANNGLTLVTIKQESNEYYFYDILLDEKIKLPLNSTAFNLRFCLDDEFIIYNDRKEDNSILEIFDVKTGLTNSIFEINDNSLSLENELLVI